jgi:NTP pyrophosphatase (non-canonical NTP hydrolase)
MSDRDPEFLKTQTQEQLLSLMAQGRISPNDARIAAGLAAIDGADVMPDFQQRVRPWMLDCFGPIIPFDKTERNHRFLEEALELVQSIGCTQSEAHQLVDYVYGRDIGETSQEVGGVMVTLAALCIANDLDMDICGEVELKRIWAKVEQIRAKQAAKPKHSPLPGPTQSEVVS